MSSDPQFQALESEVDTAIAVLETLVATKSAYVKALEEVGASTSSALNKYYGDLAAKNHELSVATAALRAYLNAK